MTFAAFLTVAVLHLFVAISPGPAVLMAARVTVRPCMEDMKGATIKIIRAYHAQLLALKSKEDARILAAETSLATLIEARTKLQAVC